MKSMLPGMACLCLFFTSPQNLKAQHFFKGIQIGIGASNSIKNRPSESKSIINYSPILSYQANIVLGFDFNKFGLTLEPGFIRRGLKTRYKFTTPVAFIYKTYYNFVQLPILAQYHFNKKTSLSIGPELYYLLKAWNVQNNSLAFTDLFERLGISGDIGIQHKLYEKLLLGIRYTQGLTRYFSTEYTDQNGTKLGRFNEYPTNLNFIAQYNL